MYDGGMRCSGAVRCCVVSTEVLQRLGAVEGFDAASVLLVGARGAKQCRELVSARLLSGCVQ